MMVEGVIRLRKGHAYGRDGGNRCLVACSLVQIVSLEGHEA